MIEPFKVETLRRICDPQLIENYNPELISSDTIIGQPRALKALETGLGIKSHGFNIFISGEKGTGKLTAVKRFLKEIAEKESIPSDWCYVNNFVDPYRPKKISLPTGKAQEFKKSMKQFILESQTTIKTAFQSEEFETRKNKIIDDLKEKKDQALNEINEEAKKENILIQPTPIGIVTIPLKNGKPLTEKKSDGLNAKEKEDIREKQKKIEIKFENFIQKMSKVEKEANEALDQLEKSTVLFVIGAIIKEYIEKYNSPEITSYLEEVKNDILDNIGHFLADNTKANMFNPGMEIPVSLVKYDVNVLTDNGGLKGAPIVIEQNPTFTNLFGKIEKESQFGALITNFTLIKEGSVHKANGGYLVIPAKELLSNPFAWDGLKRCLKNKEIEIEEATDKLGLFSTKSLKPEPIPLSIKVILVDEPFIYHLLYDFDSDFKEQFKIKADFDNSMEFNEANSKHYIDFIRRMMNEEKLLPIDNTGIAKVLEYGCKLADHQDKLSTHFGKVADILRESSYHATISKMPSINGEFINQTIENNIYRSNLVQEKIQEMIKKNVIAIELENEKVGQVNGLSVVDLGDISFGMPSKITASSNIGKEGILDIEREVELGGPIHSKGVMVLGGYLNEVYGKNELISLSARIVFEQSYSEVEGDSASSAELYSLLSSLSNKPIFQGIAVTGSVNQKGEVQAVGGVNQKIEGFFEVCKLKGLTGKQGIVIPEINLKNLMLKEEILEAVRNQQFRIWGVKTIDEGIEILTTIKGGKASEDGTFEEGSIKFLVNQRLQKMMAKIKEFASEAEEEKEELLTAEVT